MQGQHDNVSGPTHIRFQNVDYQYPGATAPAIRGVTFDLVPGRIHRTTLVIAHHGFALTSADVVFVVSNGRLVKSTERSSLTRRLNFRAQVETSDLEVRGP